MGIIVSELRDAESVRINSRSENQQSSISMDFARRCVAFRLNVVARAKEQIGGQNEEARQTERKKEDI